jgi:hypothetical protein
MNSRRDVIMVLLLCLGAFAGAQGQKSAKDSERSALGKTDNIYDRAGGVHNRSNIGVFFENRGKLYPRRANPATPSGEFPIKSGMEYIYRMNPFVGVPGNVIQGRWRENEEWEAEAGYNNRDSAWVAFSDKSYSWPASGWPVKDAAGNPVFVSDQDSYCVYNDSNNTKGVLNIGLIQTGYAFALKQFQNMVFFTYQIVNRSNRTYDSVYFGYYSDVDVGDVSGGVTEYADDKVGFNKALQLVYFYDDGYTTEWPGGRTGQFGVTLIKTPKINGVEAGITDFHYNLYDDDFDIDTLQYGIMSSAASLYASKLSSKYFHLGANAPNLHFDDPAAIPVAGADLLANIGSGPYKLGPKDTLTFVTAIVAGWTNEEILQAAANARTLVNLAFRTPRPPEAPRVKVVTGDKRVTISWDNRSELSRDPFTGNLDFQGYRIYKSVDRGQHWDQFDRNALPGLGANPVPLGQYDKVDGLGADKGLQYSYVDTNVVNGFEYWYSVTAFDTTSDPLVPSLECAQGATTTDVNLGVAIPRSDALGHVPVKIDTVAQSGTGVSNVTWKVEPGDVPEVGGKSYQVLVEPTATIARGNLRTRMKVTIDSITTRTSNTFALSFLSDTTYRIYDLTFGRTQVPLGVYASGSPINFLGLQVVLTDSLADADLKPGKGDSIVIRPGIRVLANATEVLSLRPLDYGTKYATSNGVLVQANLPYPILSVNQVSGANPVSVVANVLTASSIIDQYYFLTFDSIYTKALVTYASVQLKDSLGRKVQSLAMQSGEAMTETGFELLVTWNLAAPPVKGTAFRIRTMKQKPATYADKLMFTAAAARTNADAVTSQLSRVRVVPNPYMVSSLYEEEFLVYRREPIRQLKFINLPGQCTIRIFTIDGDIVKVIDHMSGDGTETWNMKGDGGREIAPGIYIYQVKTDSAERIDRFAVIK